MIKLYYEKNINYLNKPAKKIYINIQSKKIQLSLFSSLSLKTTTTFLKKHYLFTQKTKTLHKIFFLLSTTNKSNNSPFS